MFEVAGYPEWTEEGDVITTRAGRMTLVQEESYPPRHKVKLGETTVIEGPEGEYLTLHGSYPVGSQDVILVGNQCTGTACWVPQLSLLVLEPGKKPRRLSDDRFFRVGPSPEGPPRDGLVDGVLQLDLGFHGGKLKLARYDGEKLSFLFEDRGRPPLNEAQCKEVHESVQACVPNDLTDLCRDSDGTFDGLIRELSGVFSRSVISISQHPGFSKDGFTRACIATCRSGKPPALGASFRASVCGMEIDSAGAR